MAPKAYNAARFTSADAFSLAAGTASKTYDGFQRKKMAKEDHEQRGAVREQQIKSSQALEQATMARLEDHRMERSLRQAEADAQIQNLQWKFRQMTTGGDDAITRVSRGEQMGPDPMAGNYKDLKAMIPELSTMGPARRQVALKFAQTRIEGMIQEQRYKDAVREIQDGIEDGVILPESGEEMLKALDDATFSDASPDSILATIREQRNMVADKEAAFQLKELAAQKIEGMIMDPAAQAAYGADDDEWARRQAHALRLAARYRQHWRQVSPEDAKKHIRAVLSNAGPVSDEKRWEAAYNEVKGDDAFLELESEAEQMDYIRRTFRLMGGDQAGGGIEGPLSGLGGAMDVRSEYRDWSDMPAEVGESFNQDMGAVYLKALEEGWETEQHGEGITEVMDRYGINLTQNQHAWFKSKAQETYDKNQEPGWWDKTKGFLSEVGEGIGDMQRGNMGLPMQYGQQPSQDAAPAPPQSAPPQQAPAPSQPQPQQAPPQRARPAQGGQGRGTPVQAPTGKLIDRATKLGFKGKGKQLDAKAFEEWLNEKWNDGELKPQSWYEDASELMKELYPGRTE